MPAYLGLLLHVIHGALVNTEHLYQGNDVGVARVGVDGVVCLVAPSDPSRAKCFGFYQAGLVRGSKEPNVTRLCVCVLWRVILFGSLGSLRGV